MRLGVSWLDFKLGFRMLVKYPGLTLVGGLALTVAIGIAAAWFEFTTDMFTPRIPLEDGHRIVRVENWDVARAEPERRSLHDFVLWREQLKSIEDLGAASGLRYNLSTEDGRFASTRGAWITASALRVARVPPLLGRLFLEEDEREGAPAVVVIGYDLWQRLFDGDPGVIGRTLRVGPTPSTVIGVMPRRFAFPVNHELWVPLRVRSQAYQRREGPAVIIYGRLAPGITLDEAQAEVSAIGLRTAAAFPDTHEQLRPRVETLGQAINDLGPAVQGVKLIFLLFLVVVCINVATLVFARTVTREGELALRSALGASRRRIVLQLFVEALVLTATASGAGLAVTAWGLERGSALFWEVQQARPPFWFDADLSPSTVLYVGVITVLGAAIIGGVPALKATGRRLQPGLNELRAGGSRLRFGAVSTSVIVVQVALSVAVLPVAIMEGRELLQKWRSGPGLAAHVYLSGRLIMHSDLPPSAMPEAARDEFFARLANLHDEVRRRVAVEPGIVAVGFANRMPGMNHPVELIQFDGNPSADSVREVRVLSVDPGFFEAMGAPVVAGRGFEPADLASAVGVAIVDQSLVEGRLGGRSPIGQRVRYPGRPGQDGQQWYEIVGVVRGNDAFGLGEDVGVYHALRPGAAVSVQMFLRTASEPKRLAPRIHSIVTALDPSLSLDDLMPLEEAWTPVRRSDRFFVSMLALVGAIVLGLCLTGTYALMSFTVSQREREIGVRVALGADPRRVVTAIFSRALAQVGLGVLAGGVLVSLTVVETPSGARTVVAVAALMMAMGLLACVLPARRALRIQPTEALRADA